VAYPLRYEWDAMNKVILWLVALSLVVGAIAFAEAQQPRKIPRIGYLASGGDINNPGYIVAAFRSGLQDLGYIEGKNIFVEYRYPGAECRSDSRRQAGNQNDSHSNDGVV
jgi:hypothetical protein